MEFRDLKQQYQIYKDEITCAVENVMEQGNFVSGIQVKELEEQLAEYVGCKYCITCANGTDALSIALMVWNIGPGDAVFVPDFTFFSTAEVVSACGATPIFVDVNRDTFNIDCKKLEDAIQSVICEGKLIPKVIIPVDLFGQPADYSAILDLAKKYKLFVLEDGAQGFGGMIGEKRACSFGDISTTSFFPAKPLGCYGDGGAIFTDNEEWMKIIRSICVHGKGSFKYDNVRIGVNSRLDTLQAAILKVKLRAFIKNELLSVNKAAAYYTENLKDIVETPCVKDGYYSSWAQYVIKLQDETSRNELQEKLKEKGIPTMVYYPKPLHYQEAFSNLEVNGDLEVTTKLSKIVLALPMHPYLTIEDMDKVISGIKDYCISRG